MCGIAGLVALNRDIEPGMVETLVDGIAHRGPDDRGVVRSPSGRCVLGHARLAILDLSPTGHQPMADPDTGNVIVFNGEIYNFAELRQECERAGFVFRSHSDTEVILAMYRKLGTNCLQRLRGMFAFALWDEERQRLFFARDRLGKKPFHYARSSAGFAFCSEITPLAEHPWTDRQIDLQALDFYLHLQYIPAPFSIYRGIRKLPPGHFGILDADGLRLERYWHPDYRQKVRLSEPDAIDALEEKLSEAVRLRMVADVPVGALLSGGVDSSVIVALMARHARSPVHTFSVGFTELGFDESPYASQAARICGTAHHPALLDKPDLAILPKLARHYGEPFGDSSALPSFAVCVAARSDLKVVLNGDGGDELLGGYPRYALPAATIFLGGAARRMPFSGSGPARWLGKHVNFPWKKIYRLALQNLLLPDGGSLAMYEGGWADRDRAQLLLPADLADNLHAWRSALITEARARSDNPIDSMLWMDNASYLPGDLLVKMDIAAMHCGLEARSPLLDHELVEFCARLPANLKVRNGTGKYLLKKLAERFYPRSFVYRGKMGFGIPLATWLRGPLATIRDDVLSDPATMSPLHHPAIARCLDRFVSGDDDEATRLWYLLMYGLWRRYGVPAVLPG